MKYQILIVGTGGQGIISLGRIIMNSAMKMGFEIRGAETHGMAQRGGSVLFHVRIGNFNAVTIPKGHADVIIGLEPAEVIRNLDYLKYDGTVIVSDKIIEPNTVHVGGNQYPEYAMLMKSIKNKTKNIVMVPVLQIQKELNIPKGENLIILGSFQKALDLLDERILEETIKLFWPKFQERNLEAYDKGKMYFKNTVSISS